MRTIDQLTLEIKNEEIVHGAKSEIVGKLKSLFGLAWLDEDLDTGISLLYEASAIFHHMEQQYPETELDVDYRLGKTLEIRATTDEQAEEAKKILLHVIEKRKELDADRSRKQPEQPYAAEDEELDSTLIYFDEAMVLQQSGKLSQAESLFEQCLRLRTPKFGAVAAANVNVLLSYSDLLREMGHFQKAEEILNLALRSSAVGRSRINLKSAEVLNSLGNLQRVRTEFDKAEESLNEALSIRKEILTEHHIQVAATLNNIAELKRERGDNIAAVEYHLKSIHIFDMVGGPTHPGTINAKGNYGITLQRLARFSDNEGFENINAAMEFMYSNGYEDKHPWLTKFSNETILTEARRSAAANNFEVSIDRYDAAITRKLESHDIDKKDRKLDEMSEMDRLILKELEKERFVVLLSWCDVSLHRCKFATAADLIVKCDQYAAANLSIGTQVRQEVFWLSQLSLAKAKFARAKGNYEEALENASKASVLLENQREETHLFYISVLQFIALLHIEWARYSEVRSVLNRINKLLKIRVGKDSGTFGKAPLTVTLSLLRAQQVEALFGLAIGVFDLTQAKLSEMDTIIKAHNLLDHEINGDYLLTLSKLERIRGSHEVVVNSLEQAQLSVASHYGKEHIVYVDILQGLATSHALKGAYSSALNSVDEALHILNSMMPDKSTHPIFFETMITRAQVLHGVDRLREAREMFDKVVQQSTSVFGETPHPTTALALEGMGSVFADQYDFTSAKGHHEAAYLRWQLIFPEDSDHLYAKGSCKYARCLAQMKHYRPTPAVLQSLDMSIDYVRTSTAKLRSDGASALLADLLALKGRVLLEQGELELSRQCIGEAGAQLRSFLHSHDSPKTYEMLLLSAQITSALGKHRDAKVQISFAFARLQLLYGPMLATHRKLLDAYIVAAENMRQVGYYFDAMDCIEIVEEKVAKKFGVTSNEMLRIHFFHVLLQRDLRRLAKAEERFMEMEERIKTVYGVASKFYFDWKLQLARCLTMQNKQSRASALLQELLNDVEPLLGDSTLVKATIMNDLCYQSMVLKPNEQQLAMQKLKENILPVYTNVYGAGSMPVLHVRGRIALFMNSLKKDSGRKILFEALKAFDELKPFNLPYDHPYVLELGGYEKPSSKDRVSKNVQEDAFYAWALLDVTGENAADFLPKSLFVDVDNNDPTIWGTVFYYGVDLFNQSNVVGHGGRRGRSGSRRSSARSRSPSPTGAGATAAGSQKPMKTKSSGLVQTLVKENESLEDALIREHKARKQAEDEIVVIKHEKANLEETIEAERVEMQKMAKLLEEQHKVNDSLNTQLATANGEIAALKKQLEEVQAELQKRIEKEQEEERRKKEEEEILLAEAKRREEESAYLAAHPELIQPEDNPVYQKDLDAASFLFQRAQNLYDRGWFYKAQPFFDECCSIRERVLTLAKRSTMDSIRAKAWNLIRMSEYAKADFELHRIQTQEAAMHGVESEYSLQLSLDAAQSKMYQGFYQQATDILESSAKVLSLKSQNTGEPSRIINQLFGQCLTMQGFMSMHAGKISESKALIERGQALISRAHGVNNLMYVDSLLIKSELLILLGKGKEAVALLDQTIVTVKSLVKAAEDAAVEITTNAKTSEEVIVGSDPDPKSASATKTTPASADHDHPLVAECLLLYARAAMVMSKFTEAKRRFLSSRTVYVKFYETIDPRLFPIAVYESRLQLDICEYREARVTLTSVVTGLEKNIAQYEDFTPTPISLGQMYCAMAVLEMKTGHLELAKQFIRQVAMTMKALPTSMSIFEARMLEMKMALMAGKHLQVKEQLEEIMESIRSSLGKEHVLGVSCQLLYGESFLVASEFDEADKYFQRAIKAMRANFPEGHPLSTECLRRLVELGLQRQNLEMARQYISELSTLTNGLFAPFLGHELYPYLLGYEAKLLLLELLYGVPPTKEVEEGGDQQSQQEEKAASEEIVAAANPEANAETEAAEAAEVNEETKIPGPNDDIELPTVENESQDGGASQEEKVEAEEDVEKEIVLPPFRNEPYQLILEKLDSALERFEYVFSLVKLPPRSVHEETAKMEAPSVDNKAMWMLGAPFITYLRGLRGQVQLLEYVALQDYIRSLTAIEREHYYNIQAALQAKGKRIVPGKVLNPMDQKLPDPEGKKVMENSLAYLRQWGLMELHPFIVELDAALRELQLQYDEMEIANFLFQRAKSLKGMGRFQEADRLFEESFAMFFKCFGPIQSAQSIIMSEILLEKAEIARYLSKKIDFISSMHLQSIRMYRTNHGEITDEFVLRNLLSMTNLLMDQHLYDDALTTYRQFESTYFQSFGEFPTSDVTADGKPVDRSKFLLLVQIKSLIAECLTKLHRYDDATKVSAEALDLVKAISTGSDRSNTPVSTFNLAYLLVHIYLNDMQLFDAVGNFDNSDQMYQLIDTIFQSWEKQEATPESVHFADYSFLKAKALSLRAEHYFKVHRIHEASKASSEAYAIRNSLLNRVVAPKELANDTAEASNKSRKPADRVSKERDEEIRMGFMNALDSLVTAGLQQAREKQAALAAANSNSSPNKGLKPTEAEKEKMEENALEDEINSAMNDVRKDFAANKTDESTAGGSESSATNADPKVEEEKEVKFSVMEFLGQQDRVYLWQGEKITGHAMIVESLLFEAKLSMFLGNVAKAKEALDVSQNMLSTLYTKNSMFKLDVQFANAELRLLQNHLEDSKKQHMKILESRLSLVANRADMCLEISESLYALAKIYLLFCQYDDAMQYINDALKIERKCWSGLWKKTDQHYRIQSMMITCANILSGKGLFTDAQGILTGTITALKSMYGDLHLDISTAMAKKGQIACELGQYEEALSVLQQAKSIALVIVGDSHYFMGVLYNYVSQTLRYTGKILEAKEQLDLAVVAIRSQLGKYHYLTVLTLMDIGMNFLDLGKYTTCQHVLNRALHLLKKTLGKDHIAVAYCLYALGELHMKMGLVELVSDFYEQSLYIIRKVVGSERFPLVALIMSSKCELFGVKGHFDQAVQGMDDAIALMKLIYDSGNHYFIARSTVALARILLFQGKFHDAKVMFDRAFVTMKQTYSREHPLLFESQLGVADCLLILGRVEQAKALFERCLNGFKDWKGSSHPSIATVLNRVGDILTILNRFDAAESVLLEAWGIRMRTLKEVNENHPEIAENLVSLSNLLRLKGNIGMTKEELQKIADAQNPKSKDKKAKEKKKKQEDDFGVEELLDDALLFGDLLDDKKNKKSSSKKAAAEEEDNGNDDDGDEEEVVVMGANDQDDDEEEQSMPSIQISAIEKLDADVPEPTALETVPENGSGGSVVPLPSALDAAALKEDKKLYAAIPLLERAQQHLLAYYNNDEHHPSILTIHYHLGECAKLRGLFEESLVQHEAIFNLRRKVLGDSHLDTLLSLVAVLDVLRLTKRVFPPGKGSAGFFANAAPNNSDAAQLAAAKSSGQVTLVDHLASLTLPMAPLPAKRHHHSGEEEQEEEGFIAEDETLKQLSKLKRGIASSTISKNWRFLSKMVDPSMLPPDQQPNKKKKPLPLPKGYMGYQFPAVKQNDQNQRSTNGGSLLDATDGANAGNTGGSNNRDKDNNPLHDAKKVSDLCLQVFRKLYQPEYEALGLKKKDEHYDHPVIAQILFCKAEIYRLRADGSYAMKYIEQSLAMRRRIFRTHHPVIADCLVAIGELLRADQRYAQALPIFDKAMEIRRETYPLDDHPCIAEVFSALALVSIGQGRYLMASDYLEQAKAICDSKLGHTHPALALIYNNYAILLQAQGNMKEAMQAYRRALAIKQKVFGSLHPETAATMNNMGLLLKAQGRLDAAVTVFRKTLDIQRKVFGQRHPDVATTENNLAAILSQQEGQKFAAKELLKSSLITRMEIFGAEHAVVASTMNNLAVLLFTLGEIGQAKEYFEEALKVRRKLLGEDHPAVAEVQHNLGYWFYAQGYLVEAKRSYEDAIRIRRKIFTSSSELSSPAAGTGEMGDLAGEGKIEETEQQRRAKSLAVSITALHLSGVCDQAGDLTRALAYIEEAYQIRFDLLGEWHPETSLCKKSMAYIQNRIQAQTGMRATSSSSAQRAGSASKQQPPTSHSQKAPVTQPPPSHLGFETGVGQQSVSVGEENQVF